MEREEARAALNRPPRKTPAQKRRDRDFANPYTFTLPGGEADIELRQERAAAKAARATQKKSRSVRART